MENNFKNTKDESKSSGSVTDLTSSYSLNNSNSEINECNEDLDNSLYPNKQSALATYTPKAIFKEISLTCKTTTYSVPDVIKLKDTIGIAEDTKFKNSSLLRKVEENTFGDALRTVKMCVEVGVCNAENAKSFEDALRTLRTWMEDGFCNEENSKLFYCLIQSAHSRLGLLMNDIEREEAELYERKLNLKYFMEDLLLKFDEMEKIFKPVCIQKIWNYVEEGQRRYLKEMKKHCGENRNKVLNQLIAMTNDDMNESENKQDTDMNYLREQKEELKKENEALGARLEVLKKVLKEKKEIRSLLQSERKRNFEIMKNDQEHPTYEESNLAKHFKSNNYPYNLTSSNSPNYSDGAMKIVEKEVHLVGLIAIFLASCPSGANLTDVISYLQQKDCTIKASDVENLVKRFPKVFTEVSSNELDRNIKFLGY